MEVDIPVTITRWVSDEPQPGLVEFEIVDRHGKAHAFQAKVPYVSAKSLWSDSVYPQPGSLRTTLADSAIEGADVVSIDVSGWVIGQDGEGRVLEVVASG